MEASAEQLEKELKALQKKRAIIKNKTVSKSTEVIKQKMLDDLERLIREKKESITQLLALA